MKVQTAEQMKEQLTHIVSFYEDGIDRFIVDYITDTRLSYLEGGDQADVCSTMHFILEYLHFNLAIFEDSEDYEVCALINKVVHIEIEQMKGYLKRHEMYEEKYDKIFETMRLDSRKSWTIDRANDFINNTQEEK